MLIDGGRSAAESAAAASALGLQNTGVVEPEVLEVWPEHWPAVRLFSAMGTQWSVGMAGPTGLRYEAIPFILRMQGVAEDQWLEVFDGLRTMEAEALRYFAERREQKE